MTNASNALATIDARPFFDKALRYGVDEKIISPERLQLIQEEFAKGIVQIAKFFATEHLRPELELAQRRMVNLISLYLENMSGGFMKIAAASLRDKSLLSHSKAGSDMLRRLHAMPDNCMIIGNAPTPESQHAYLDEKTAAHSIPFSEYLAELTQRQEIQRRIDFAFWLARKTGVARDAVDEADWLIRSAMLVIFVNNAKLKIPTRNSFVGLIKSARKVKAKLDLNRLEAILSDAPAEFQILAQREMKHFIEMDLPLIRDPEMTADKLLSGRADIHFFINANVDDDVREYVRKVAKEWSRVTRGHADDPAVLATVFLFIATGLPPKSTMLWREAKEIIRIFRDTGFDSQAVIDYIDLHAPEADKASLKNTWMSDIKIEVEDHLSDHDPDRPDSHMDRALEYLRTSCSVTWLGRRNKH